MSSFMDSMVEKYRFRSHKNEFEKMVLYYKSPTDKRYILINAGCAGWVITLPDPITGIWSSQITRDNLADPETNFMEAYNVLINKFPHVIEVEDEKHDICKECCAKADGCDGESCEF